MKKRHIFLGGTCSESNWRTKFISYIDKNVCSWFDPVVDDWTEVCMKREIKERQTCDFCLYTITPKMTGVYSIAEVIDDSNKRPHKTIFVILKEDSNKKFTEAQRKSLGEVAKMVKRNGGQFFDNLKSAADYMNNN